MTAPSTIPELLDERAASHPDAIALRTPHGTATYGDLIDLSTRLAARLVHMGARKGTVVALVLPNGIDWVAWWAACARIGAVVVPVNTFATPAEVRRILEHSGAHVLLAIPEFAGHSYRAKLEEEIGPTDPEHDLVAPRLPQLRRVLWLDGAAVVFADRGEGEIVAALASDVVPADTLTIIYSSGSTGDPKGVVHSHGATLRQAERLARLTRSHRSTVLWTSMPLNWVGGLVWSLLRTIVRGGTFVTQERFDPGSALLLLREAEVDTVTAWGPGIQQLRDHSDYDPQVFGHIRGLGVLVPGDPSRPSALGMTETLGPHSGWFGELDDPVPVGAAGSMGQVLPGMEIRIVGLDTGSDVPDGETGELLVRGDTLMSGIHRRERQDVFTSDGWYQTGDAVSQRKGWLFFEGRLDDVIKTNGANVSPAEVQAVFADHPSVGHVFVVGVPHPSRGQDVAAVVVPTDGSLDVASLLARARDHLASYKVPRHVHVMREDEIPWLSSQKVDRRRLQAMVQQR